MSSNTEGKLGKNKRDDLSGLKKKIKGDIEQMRKANREKDSLFAQTAYLGTLGILLALPIVAGAYLGAWLDGRLEGYSFSWTILMIILGSILGAFNAYLFIKEREED